MKIRERIIQIQRATYLQNFAWIGIYSMTIITATDSIDPIYCQLTTFFGIIALALLSYYQNDQANELFDEVTTLKLNKEA